MQKLLQRGRKRQLPPHRLHLRKHQRLRQSERLRQEHHREHQNQKHDDKREKDNRLTPHKQHLVDRKPAAYLTQTTQYEKTQPRHYANTINRTNLRFY